MQNPVHKGLLLGFQPRFKGSTVDWLEKHVRIPHSARSSQFIRDTSPWLNEIYEDIGDDHIRCEIVIAPTGGGKTTLLETSLCFMIAARPGPAMLVGQTDDLCKEFSEERLIPMFNLCEPVARLFPTDRHQKRKTAIFFGHAPLFLVGANLSSLQEKSLRYCIGDEVWRWKDGMIGELKKRHHDRYAALTLLVSQGFDAGHELEKEVANSEVFEWGTECRECGNWSNYPWSDIKFEQIRTADGEWDWDAIGKSVHHECSVCGLKTEDTTGSRREMAKLGCYRGRGGNYLKGHRMRTWTAQAVWWIEWKNLVFEWLNAMDEKQRGNIEPLKQFKQKRQAQMWKPDADLPTMALESSDYSLEDFKDGQLIDNERVRFMTVDVQESSFWACIRAFSSNSYSKLLWEGQILNAQDLRALQLRYKVKDKMTFLDGRYKEQEGKGESGDGRIFDVAAKFGWHLLFGTGQPYFTHKDKRRHFWSEPRFVVAPTVKRPGTNIPAQIAGISWSNEGVKDILARLRMVGPPMWEFPRDVSPGYLKQMNSEIKRETINPRTKKSELKWVRTRKDNHLWDTECMQIVCALIFRLLPDIEDTAGTPS